MDIKSYLDNSYTAYHAVANASAMLDEEGFSELRLDENWTLEEGGKYYVKKNGTCLIAFRIGEQFSYMVAESHTDSPSLHVKGNSLIPSPEGKRLNVEKYGGAILYSLTDIPLKLAGRLVVNDNGTLRERTVVSDFFLNVPSLAIHHNPNVNDGCALNVQTDMLPLIGDIDDLYSTLTTEEVIGSDLYVVPAVECYQSGAKGEYVCSPRIDNLTSVYASIRALLSTEPRGIAVAACFDNEEIGSRTKQGADSVLLETILRKISRSLNKTEEEYLAACENGFLLSIDNAHAVHPAHPEKFDPAEKVVLNGGIVVKHHVNYSTDALSSAIVKTILDRADIPRQDYYNRSDLRCGSTLGLMSSASLSMNACDVGIAQLAMHSAIETAGKEDLMRMEKFIRSFFSTSLESKDGGISIAD